jgi:anthranilate phosphoribosyltransferase
VVLFDAKSVVRGEELDAFISSIQNKAQRQRKPLKICGIDACGAAGEGLAPKGPGDC